MTAAAAGVAVSGIALIRKHTKYLSQKAAAAFDPEEEEDWFAEAEAAGTPEEAPAEESAGEAEVPEEVPAADDEEEEA